MVNNTQNIRKMELERKKVYSFTLKPSVADALLLHVAKANQNGITTSQSQVVEQLITKHLKIK